MIYDDLLEELGGHPYQGYFYSNCPFPDHSDSKPSLCVWEDADKEEGAGRFKCMGCGKKGTHAYLMSVVRKSPSVMKIVVKQDKFLPRWAAWQRQYGNLKALADMAHSNVVNHPDYQWYFKKRNIMGAYETAYLGMKDGWAMFPVHDQQGNIVDIICRNTQKFGESRYIVHPDKERDTPYLYVPNWKRVMKAIDSRSIVYIVYGIIDAVALELAELPVITGSTGKSLSNKRLMNLSRFWCIIPDRHEEAEAYELSHSLGIFSSVLRLPYEDDEKDPDDVRMKRGLPTLKKLILGE